MIEMAREIESERYYLALSFVKGTRVAILLLKDVNLRRTLRASLLFSYSGRKWIKASGGKTITSRKMYKILPEVQAYTKDFFGLE